MKLRTKMLLILLSSVSITYIIVFSFIVIRFKTDTYNKTIEQVNTIAREKTNEIQLQLNENVGLSRTLAISMSSLRNLPDSIKWEVYEKLITEVHSNSKGLLAIYSSFELSYFQKGYTKNHGRLSFTTYSTGKQLSITKEYRNMDKAEPNSNYSKILISNKETIDPPYLYSATNDPNNNIRMTSYSIPIEDNETAIGIVGFDLSLKHFQIMADIIKPFPNSNAYFISHDGQIVNQKDNISETKLIKDVNKEIAVSINELIENTDTNQYSEIIYFQDIEQYVVLTTFKIGNSGTKWTLIISTPLDTILQEANKSIWLTIALACIGLLLISIVIFFVMSKLISSILYYIDFTKQIHAGNLKSELIVTRNDEIGELGTALLGIAKSFRNIINKIKETTDNITTSSEELSSNSMKIAQDANRQAANVEEVSASMQTMVDLIQQTANHSKDTNKIVQNSKTEIVIGSNMSEEAAKAMDTIAGKIKMISDIAFQTNLLALNAAVEAARANEHGKGFSVVAAEVKKLAENSKTIAQEINDYSLTAVDASKKTLDKLKQLIPEVEQASVYIQEISNSSDEQNQGTMQINNAITELNSISQTNAAASEELAGSAELLTEQAQELKKIVASFIV